MTAQEFHNNRVNLYSNLRDFQSIGNKRAADRMAIAIEELEAEYYNQYKFNDKETNDKLRNETISKEDYKKAEAEKKRQVSNEYKFYYKIG